MTTIADQINSHLRGGGAVRVATYTRNTVYNSAHVGQFTMRDDSLYVRRGRRLDRLSHGERLLVAIRFGRLTAQE